MPLLDLPNQDETIIRYFITTGSALAAALCVDESLNLTQSCVQTIMTLPFAQFIWVVEFLTEAQWAAGQIARRAVIDATASLREVMPLWLFHSRTKP